MRFDFLWEVSEADDETRIVTVVARPHPKRYERQQVDGKTIYYDRFLKIAFPEEVVASMMRQMVGQSMSYTPPAIKSSGEYASRRVQAIQEQLASGQYQPPIEQPSQHRPLTTGTEEVALTFLSVDICGSTALRAKSAVDYDQSHALLLQELGTVIGHFHGSILKLTGDGFIAYFDTESNNSRCDNTVDCALSAVDVLLRGLNPALEAKGLPALSIRVGADHGNAVVRTYAVPATGYSQVDFVSDALNRTVKIQEMAEDNSVCIGASLYECLHLQWLERCVEVDFDTSSLSAGNYRVYAVS